MRPAASVWLTALGRRGLCWCGLAGAAMKQTHRGPYLLSLWGPRGLQGGIRITYCTGSWPCVCVSMWGCFFSWCERLCWGGGGSREVLITASYQVSCKCVIGPNFLMSISTSSCCCEYWQGKRLCHCFLGKCTVSESQQGEWFNGVCFMYPGLPFIRLSDLLFWQNFLLY